jgi:hypothetical protein
MQYGLAELGIILEHIGVGFFVSATAIVFYEWGGHIKDAVVISTELRKIRDAAGHQAVEDVLKVLFGGDHDPLGGQIAKSIAHLVEYLTDLEKHGDWAKDVYRRYLSGVLDNTTTSASALSDVSTGNESSNDRGITLFTPAQRTDSILVGLLQSMPPESSYTVVSDVDSWADSRLERFLSLHGRALENRILIRRIFVLAPNRAPANDTARAAALKVIQEHFMISQVKNTDPTDVTREHARQSFGYHVRVLDLSLLEKKCSNQSRAHYLFRSHFGVFQHRQAEHALRVRIENDNLSKVYFMRIDPESDDIESFNWVWDRLGEQTLTEMKASVKRWRPTAVQGVERRRK